MYDITLEKLRLYSGRSNTLVTVDAPLFGTVLLFQGRLLNRGTHAAPEKIGMADGFPAPRRVVSEATRFWIQDALGVRKVKTRGEMARLLAEA
jgi:hypothetical protein